MVWISLLPMASGIFAILGAFFQWSFFMNHRKAQFFIKLLGVQGTRVFYGVLGVALLIFGVLMAFNVFDLPSDV